MIAINTNPGSTILLAVETKDGYSQRVDGYMPAVDFIITPSGSEMSGYPANMANISTGLWNASVSIPSGITATGTYIASVSWTNPATGYTSSEIFLINVFLPYGLARVSAA